MEKNTVIDKNKYCETCKKEYTTRPKLLIHYKTQLHKDNLNKDNIIVKKNDKYCETCKKEFKSRPNLLEHYDSKIHKYTLEKSVDLDRKESVEEIINEQKEKQEKTLKKQPEQKLKIIDGEVFNVIDEDDEIIYLEKIDVNKYCKTCNKSFSTIYKLDRHNSSKSHKDKLKQEKSNSDDDSDDDSEKNHCDVCNTNYVRKDSYQEHLKSKIHIMKLKGEASVDKDKKICTKCKVEKKLDEYNIKTRTESKNGLMAICKECEKVYQKERSESLHGRLGRLVGSAKHGAKVRLERGRTGAGICDKFIKEILEEQYNKQRGMCFYFPGKEMNTKFGEWQMSIERLDTNKGYIKGNVVLCCLEFNGTKQWTLEKIQYMLNNINNTNNEKLSIIKKYLNTKYYYLKSITSDTDINVRYLLKIIKEQSFKCNYSNIPLTFNPNKDWNCSIERIDISKGYYRGNVCFVCNEFNTSDRTYLNKIEDGSYWSKGKFKEYYNFLIENVNKKFDTDCIFNHLITK